MCFQASTGKLPVNPLAITKAGKLILLPCDSWPSAAEITHLSKLRKFESLALRSAWAAPLVAAPALALGPVCRS